MKKTVFFDLGNVLLYFSHKKMCEQVADTLSLSPETIYDHLYRIWGEDYELGRMSSYELYQHLTLLSDKEVKFVDLLHAASDIFVPNNNILPLLEKLKMKDLKLVLLSNTNEAHFNFAYSNFEHLKYFDAFVLSYQLKLAKPDKRIFHRALSLAHVIPELSFYTDDLKQNVRSAKKIGIESHHFKTTELLEEKLVQSNFL